MKDIPQISVIIPTYNRGQQLLGCLASLKGQTLSESQTEILVIDDGSTDRTFSKLQPLISSGRVRYFFQRNGGPARARNVGIRNARGRWLLFIGDDIIADSRLLEEHVSCHRQTEGQPIAVLGFTDWANTIEVTPLMKYEGRGAQFGYQCIGTKETPPDDLPYRFFYTANVSINRQFLLENRLLFDEDFTCAMGEDGELAYRLQKAGLRIVYHPAAIAYHEHPTTFDNLCRRAFLKGQVAVLQVMKHPEWGNLDFLNLTWRGKMRHGTYRLAADLIHPLLAMADDRRWPIQGTILQHLYDFVFTVHQFEGLQRGLRVYGRETNLKEGGSWVQAQS